MPWLTIYDYTNYARWIPVYFMEMSALEIAAPEVYQEFMAGNFVVKKTNRSFNQVPIDQATEWMNKLCKLSNGIIGITKTDTARDKQILSHLGREIEDIRCYHIYDWPRR